MRAVIVSGQIVGGEHADDLRRHRLADGDPEWEFKRAVFLTSLVEAMNARKAEDQDAEADPGMIRRFLKKVRHPLRAANVILRSLASAIPGGGAFNEIKDGVEAAVDKVTEDA